MSNCIDKLPPWAIMINHGYDGDYECLDTRNVPDAAGDYPVIYRSEGREHSTPYKTFTDYIEACVLHWAQHHLDNKNRSGSLRSKSRDIVPKIEAILAQEP